MAIPVAEAYRELYHYTTVNGLLGIVSNQVLWATHIGYLNDAEEQIGFFERRLATLIETPAREAIVELAKMPSGKSAIDKMGGSELALTSLVRDLATGIRSTSATIYQPYVASFCGSPVDGKPNDGLLSQWRGYGHDGGYAIVFDTAALESLIRFEEREFHYLSVLWGDVDYVPSLNGGDLKHPETKEWELLIHETVKNFVLLPSREKLEPLFEPIVALSCRHKHAGFHEEAEVRIAVMNPAEHVRVEARTLGERRELKRVNFLTRDGMLLPYVSLFERKPAEQQVLPIKRIIVGPHPDKLKRKKAVEMLLAEHKNCAEVVFSDIPYLGR